ncbi:IS5/IS1182 family transposase, partial [Lactobacillus amylovorus]
VKPSNFHFKNKKHRNSLKIMNCCVFISGLKIEFFPRHLFLQKKSLRKMSLMAFLHLQISSYQQMP